MQIVCLNVDKLEMLTPGWTDRQRQVILETEVSQGEKFQQQQIVPRGVELILKLYKQEKIN